MTEDMQWPQYIVLALFVLGFIAAIVSRVRNTDLTSTQATFGIFFYAVWYSLYAWLLHMGGFW